MKRICVFAGSASGRQPAYAAAARQLAGELVRRRLGLVYGGGSIGLMGALADAVLADGGEVIGVIPAPLAGPELAHGGLTELRVVPSMHERKALMGELADAFIALPGGLGTLEEMLEVLTWAQLGIHDKPLGLLNVQGYYDRLLGLLAHAVSEGFVRADHAALLAAATTPGELLDRFAAWRPAGAPRAWLTPRQV
jgi:uncharacterized protein (TIGR00730 family)